MEKIYDGALITMDLCGFKNRFSSAISSQMGDDFFIANFHLNESVDLLESPCKFDGYFGIFCERGLLEVSVNLTTYKLDTRSLVLIVPGNVISIRNLVNSPASKVFILAMSKDFISRIHVDFYKLFCESLSMLSSPCITLAVDEVTVCRKYMDVVAEVMDFPMNYKNEALGAIISSVLYLLGSIWNKRLSTHKHTNKLIKSETSVRSKLIFDSFIKLVTEHYMRHRGVKFYSQKMSLTPKYLSKLIKSISGRSAPEWIDSFVLMEAKNLLKYSDISIKEIVYKLNFPNQSVFYKYFKNHTGLTPSKYRKGQG